MKNRSFFSGKAFYWAAVVLFILFTLGPLIWALIISVTPEFEMLQKGGGFLPDNPTLSNFLRIFSENRQSKIFWQGMRNSVLTASLCIVFCVPAAGLCAYALSRLRFRGRLFIKRLLLVTMAIPVFATIIPLYKVFSDNKMLDNMFWLALVYVSSFLPVCTWLMSNYFDSLPIELEEASYLDGCTPVSAFFRTILPLSYPAILACTLLCFLMSWNQFQIPMILASSLNTKPISIVVSEFDLKDSIQYGLTAASGIMAVLPPAILAVVFRKYLTRGMSSGSTTG